MMVSAEKPSATEEARSLHSRHNIGPIVWAIAIVVLSMGGAYTYRVAVDCTITSSLEVLQQLKISVGGCQTAPGSGASKNIPTPKETQPAPSPESASSQVEAAKPTAPVPAPPNPGVDETEMEPPETEVLYIPLDEIEGINIGMMRSEFLKLMSKKTGQWTSIGNDAVFSHTTPLFGWDGIVEFRFNEDRLSSVLFSLEANWYKEDIVNDDLTASYWKPPQTRTSGSPSLVERRCGESEKTMSSKFIEQFGGVVKPVEEEVLNLATPDIEWCEGRGDEKCEAQGTRRNKQMRFSQSGTHIKYWYSGLTASGSRQPGYKLYISMEMKKCLYQISFW